MKILKRFGIYRCFLLLFAAFLLSFAYVRYSFSSSSDRLLKRPLYTLQNFTFAEKRSASDIDQWIYIDDDVYIYSAYWEIRFKPSFVRIVGIGLNKKRSVSDIHCALRYNSGKIIATEVEFNIITENHGQKHTAGFYICHTDEVPSHVALFVKNRSISKWLKVNRIEPSSKSDGRLAICVQPLYGKFANNSLHVAEFISYYQLLNVSRFIFYNYKPESSVISLITELMKSGEPIDLLNWDLPDEVSNTWTHAQMASIVDCTYRQSQSYEYVLIVDVDELLVPRHNTTLQNIVSDLDNTSKRKWPTYMFRHSFFCLQLPDNPDFGNASIKLFTLTKTTRQKKIWAPYFRCKSIVRPFLIQVSGIHYTWSTTRHSNDIMEVDPDIALLHHYRSSKTECLKNTVDKSAVEFGLLILNSKPIKVWESWRIITQSSI